MVFRGTNYFQMKVLIERMARKLGLHVEAGLVPVELGSGIGCGRKGHGQVSPTRVHLQEPWNIPEEPGTWERSEGTCQLCLSPAPGLRVGEMEKRTWSGFAACLCSPPFPLSQSWLHVLLLL